MPGWRHQWEEDCGKKCQRWVVTRDSTGCCEHEGCNIAVFTRTLVSILHSQWRNNHLFRRKNRMVQPDSLNVGSLISERVRSGLAKARAHGKQLGRPKTSPETIKEIKRLRRKGTSLNKIAK